MLDSTGPRRASSRSWMNPRTDAATAATKIAGGLACDGALHAVRVDPDGRIGLRDAAYAPRRRGGRMRGRSSTRRMSPISPAARSRSDPLGACRASVAVRPPKRCDRRARRHRRGGHRHDRARARVRLLPRTRPPVLRTSGASSAANWTRVKVIGAGGIQSLWVQLKADLLGVPVSVAGVDEVVSRGAQALAHGVRRPWETSLPHDVSPDAERQPAAAAWAAAPRPGGNTSRRCRRERAASSERKAQR